MWIWERFTRLWMLVLFTFGRSFPQTSTKQSSLLPPADTRVSSSPRREYLLYFTESKSTAIAKCSQPPAKIFEKTNFFQQQCKRRFTKNDHFLRDILSWNLSKILGCNDWPLIRSSHGSSIRVDVHTAICANIRRSVQFFGTRLRLASLVAVIRI